MGVAKSKKLQEDIPNKVRDTLCIIPEVIPHKKDDKEYLEIVVPENPTPVSYKNKFYYRSGTVTSELTGTALHSFLLEKMGGKWDSLPVENVTIEDLDQESFDIFKQESIRSGRMNRQDYPSTREELLDKLRLITDDGKLTRAAILLFHRDPERWVSGAFCKVAKFGEGPDLRYHDEVHGSLMMQAVKMMDLIYTKYLIPKISYHPTTRQRIETYPFPRDGVREGLYNALMHNFYMRCVPIQIRINPDEMWISNDLAFNSKWTPERLIGPHRSDPYNLLIANAFFKAGFVEIWGRGISNMIKDCINHGCPAPYYIDQPDGIMLILKAHPDTIALQSGEINKTVSEPNNTLENIQKEGESTLKNEKCGQENEKCGQENEKCGQENEKCDQENEKCGLIDKIINDKNIKTKIKVLFLILKDKNYTIKEIAQQTTVATSSIKRHLKRLKEENVLEHIGSTKGGYWKILPAGLTIIQNILNDLDTKSKKGNHSL